MDVGELLERVRKATGPDMVLDAMLYGAFDLPDPISHPDRTWTVDPSFYAEMSGYDWPERHLLRSNDGQVCNPDRSDCPWYTASVDAALALVERMLPGWGYSVNGGPQIAASTTLWPPNGAFGDEVEGTAATPVLSILAALLSALAKKGRE